MNDDDLIRRGDALEAIAAVLAQRSGNDDFGNIMRDVRLQNEADQDAIRALPAAAPRPMGEARDLPPGTKVLAWWPGRGDWMTTWREGATWRNRFAWAYDDDDHAPTHFLPHPETPE
jgi:hypothetical protein